MRSLGCVGIVGVYTAALIILSIPNAATAPGVPEEVWIQYAKKPSQEESDAVPVESLEAVKTVPESLPKLVNALVPVCSCESSGSPYNDPMDFHYEKDGKTLLIGRITPLDRGMCQINLGYHLVATREMGLDILNSVADYITYSNWLYETQGLRPWKASQHCWGM